MIDWEKRYSIKEASNITGVNKMEIIVLVSRKYFEPISIESTGKRKHIYEFDFINLFQIMFLFLLGNAHTLKYRILGIVLFNLKKKLRNIIVSEKFIVLDKRELRVQKNDSNEYQLTWKDSIKILESNEVINNITEKPSMVIFNTGVVKRLLEDRIHGVK